MYIISCKYVHFVHTLASVTVWITNTYPNDFLWFSDSYTITSFVHLQRIHDIRYWSLNEKLNYIFTRVHHRTERELKYVYVLWRINYKVIFLLTKICFIGKIMYFLYSFIFLHNLSHDNNIKTIFKCILIFILSLNFFKVFSFSMKTLIFSFVFWSRIFYLSIIFMKRNRIFNQWL